MELLVCLFFIAAAPILPSSWATEAPPVVVGRVFEIEGDLLRYVPAEQDWVAVVRDAPSASRIRSIQEVKEKRN